MRNPVGTATAARLLNLRPNDAVKNSRGLPGQAATYFWDPVCGGSSVIVAADGTYLYANSSVTEDRHMREFGSGLRTTARS